MVGLLSVFAEFEKEILREHVCTGFAHARKQGKRLGRPPSWPKKQSKPESCTGKAQQIQDRTPASNQPNLGPPPSKSKES